MSVFVKQSGAWHEIPSGGAGLPGLGGWADITTATGNPTKHAYKDAAGVDWVAYEWTSSGSCTTTEGLVDSLLVGGGAGAYNGNTRGDAGRFLSGIRQIPSGSHIVTVGPGGSPANVGNENALLGLASSIGSYATGVVSAGGGQGAGSTATDIYAGMPSSITGVLVEYAQGNLPSPRPNKGDGGTPPSGPAGSSGCVIVRVPRANAKA